MASRGAARAVGGAAVVPASTWTVDPARSRVGFKLRHLMVVPVKGRFTAFEGALAVGDGASSARGSVRVATIDTGDATRDERLLGPEFFDAARRPEIRFASTHVEPLGADTLRIVGELTIRDATREIELRARRTAASAERVELDLDGELSRREFGTESAALLEAGISDRVELALHVSLRRAA